jgi:hypothetical protein
MNRTLKDGYRPSAEAEAGKRRGMLQLDREAKLLNLISENLSDEAKAKSEEVAEGINAMLGDISLVTEEKKELLSAKIGELYGEIMRSMQDMPEEAQAKFSRIEALSKGSSDPVSRIAALEEVLSYFNGS